MEVDVSRLVHLVKTLEHSGAQTDVVGGVLKKSGLTRKDVALTSKDVDYEKEAKFVREACELLGDLTFGARAGLSWRESNSLTGYISKYSKDLRAAIENTARFHEIVDPAIRYELRISSNFAAFEVSWKDASYAKYHRHTEFLMFGVLSRMRAITQSDFYPIEIRFDHEVRNSRSDFQKVAGFSVVFGAETLEMILPLPVLDLPIPTYDLRLREHLTEYGERLLAERGSLKQSLRSKVERLLTAALPARMLSADEIAASVGMSARTFARRLKEEGTSFRDIVDELRFDLSKTFMKDGMRLAEIAFSLGYADQAAFSTAFKRWAGVAPSSFHLMN
ncbi:helix-turn-helix domain-containing protein [Shimia abyssi]|uniref:AraC family transcriptional regulator n=1 Tax=Shimia abyssi TaxID=1662395 RepID=A0A2P8F5Z3_9RHOB|nr:AraC family transcriptional regulator [Shimia abyssi]PSL17143.1 AraC family transcriptional regulator [Shimia abyssi]